MHATLHTSRHPPDTFKKLEALVLCLQSHEDFASNHIMDILSSLVQVLLSLCIRVILADVLPVRVSSLDLSGNKDLRLSFKGNFEKKLDNFLSVEILILRFL